MKIYSVLYEDILKVTEFTLSVYGVDSPQNDLLDVRFDRLTSKKISSFRSLPPSPGASIMQFRKAVHIAAFIWGKAHEAELNPPDMYTPYKAGETLMGGWRISGLSFRSHQARVTTVVLRRHVAAERRRAFAKGSVLVGRQ